MKKRYIFLILIFIIFFLFFYYKIKNSGNNIIKQNKEDIIASILSDTLKYKAKCNIKIISNKNENQYRVKIIENEKYHRLEVIEDEKNISGLIVENTKEKLILKNTKLSLEKIFENYKPMANNCLFLSSFSDEYRNNCVSKETKDDKCTIIKIKLKNSSKYIKYKELYINKDTGLPEKLVIKDSDKHDICCIEYTNIEIL